MSLIDEKAFVLSYIKYRNSSKIITLFSENYGRFNAVAKSVRNMNSGISAVFQNINYIKISLNFKNNYELQTIRKGEIIDSYDKIKNDYDKLMIAYRICELAIKTTENYEINTPLFELLRIIFQGLSQANKNYLNYLLFYQIKLSKMLGIGTYPHKTNNFYDNNFVLKDETKSIESTYNYKKDIEVFMHIDENEIKKLEDIYIRRGRLLEIQNLYDNYIIKSFNPDGYLKTKKI